MGSGENRIGKFYDRTTTPEYSEDRTAVPTWWRRKGILVHTPHTHILRTAEWPNHEHWMQNPSIGWPTLGSWVTQPLSVLPSIPETNTRHHAYRALNRIHETKHDTIPLTPQGHFVPQLYHKTVRAMSSLKTSSYYMYKNKKKVMHKWCIKK